MGVHLDAASPAEVNLLGPTLATIAVPRPGPGRPRQKPERVIADKAYDSDPLRGRLARREVERGDGELEARGGAKGPAEVADLIGGDSGFLRAHPIAARMKVVKMWSATKTVKLARTTALIVCWPSAAAAALSRRPKRVP